MTSERPQKKPATGSRAISDYFRTINALFADVQLSDEHGGSVPLDAGTRTVSAGLVQVRQSNKVMLVGNGGSAAIAAHLVADLSNRVGLRTQDFQDVTVLTALSNDFDYQSAYEKMVLLWAKAGDVLIAISSSGQSENILRAARAARKRGCDVVTLSGFNDRNPLRGLGDYNFYVASNDYGEVEIVHHALGNYLVEAASEAAAKDGQQ